jgi:branched-chain amino acid aminotransferase
MKTYYVDGKFVRADQAVIPVDDLAVLRGYGVLDIMRTFNKKPYFLDEHIRRLEHSAEKIGLSLPWSGQEIIGLVRETLGRNRLKGEANIRIIITGGTSSDFFHPQGNPRLIILVTDLPTLPDAWYTKGIKVITHPAQRSLPDAKVISYIPAALALKKARKQDAVEALYVNQKGEALEGTTSNLFAFFGDTLATPKEGVLKGITRQSILDLAKDLFTIEEGPLQLARLLTANEVFITGTNKGIVPVIQIDDTRIGTGEPGPNTRRLTLQMEDFMEVMGGEV